MNRETRLAVAAVIGLAAFVVLLMAIGGIGPERPELDPLTVEEALADGHPAQAWGNQELHVLGWYAELDADCSGDTGGVDASIAWLQRDCPLRVLMLDQPEVTVSQATLEAEGLRLAAPLGNVFPSRAEPTGPNLRGGQLVYVGHFDDSHANECVPERAERCRNTFVVTSYDELVH